MRNVLRLERVLAMHGRESAMRGEGPGRATRRSLTVLTSLPPPPSQDGLQDDQHRGAARADRRHGGALPLQTPGEEAQRHTHASSLLACEITSTLSLPLPLSATLSHPASLTAHAVTPLSSPHPARVAPPAHAHALPYPSPSPHPARVTIPPKWYKSARVMKALISRFLRPSLILLSSISSSKKSMTGFSPALSG